jgi:hypothetical protein
MGVRDGADSMAPPLPSVQIAPANHLRPEAPWAMSRP